MGKRKERSPEEQECRAKIRELLELSGVSSMADIQERFKKTIAEFMEESLEAERSEDLGYSKYDYKHKETENSRNGYSSKKLRTSYGEVEVSVPWDRKGEFEPQLLKKNQASISQDIEEKVLSIYAKGMSTGDIEAHIRDIYGLEVSDTTVSRITDKILPVAKEWQQRPLESVYAAVFLKVLVADLNAAVDEASTLEVFAQRWDKKYPKISSSWRDNWPHLSAYFKYPQEIRRLIYTANAIEGFNRQLHKATKAKSVFPTNDSLLKMLYLIFPTPKKFLLTKSLMTQLSMSMTECRSCLRTMKRRLGSMILEWPRQS